MGESEDRWWKVGELANATGLTVRTLHHYDAIGLLAPSERTSAGHRLYAEPDVGRLYHVLALRRLGMRLEEIASLLDDDASLVDTVRRHLEQVEREMTERHVLHQRLRQILDALERAIEPTVEEFIDAMEAMTVIEIDVKDVVVQIPDGAADEPPPRLPRESLRVVLLEERSGERVLPIWVGAHEGDLLAARLGEWPQGRPMTPDLTVELLKAAGARIERVVIESARELTFYASVTVTAGGESHEVDARPSDALNLAVRVGAPVFVAAEVLDQSGVRGAETTDQWQSLSPDLIRSLYPREAQFDWLRYTKEARRVMTAAQEEARALSRGCVGLEHLLLGLVREQGLAARVLASLEITAEHIRDRLAHTGGSGEDTPSGMVPYTPGAQRVFRLALEEEPTHLPNRVGPEHLLLGLVSADDQALRDLGADPERVREELHRAMAAPRGGEVQPDGA